MYRFRRLATDVEAIRIGSDGSVKIGGRSLLGSPGFWVVIDPFGKQTNWSDEEFRQYFEPTDVEAEAYLLLTKKGLEL